MQLDARAYQAAIDLERLAYELASYEINKNAEALYGEPPSIDEDGNYKAGKKVNIEELKSLLEKYYLY